MDVCLGCLVLTTRAWEEGWATDDPINIGCQVPVGKPSLPWDHRQITCLSKASVLINLVVGGDAQHRLLDVRHWGPWNDGLQKPIVDFFFLFVSRQRAYRNHSPECSKYK